MRWKVYFAIALLAGCATTAGYERSLEGWVGKSIDDVVAAWGAPANTQPLPSGSVAYQWRWTGETRLVDGLSGATAVTAWCNTTFLADREGVVRRWQWEGNSCRQ